MSVCTATTMGKSEFGCTVCFAGLPLYTLLADAIHVPCCISACCVFCYLHSDRYITGTSEQGVKVGRKTSKDYTCQRQFGEKRGNIPGCSKCSPILRACLVCSGLAGQDLTPMSLGLSHSLSRYKLKFSPDKVQQPAHQPCSLHASLSLS